jgi:hypothetical protein
VHVELIETGIGIPGGIEELLVVGVVLLVV